jgi:hypothetical protein
MVDRVADKLQTWKCQIMHCSDRLALVTSMLAAMTVYVSINIGLPRWLLKALEKIMKGLLWTGTEVVQNCKCTIAFGNVQCPLQLGGLGIIDLKLFGMALRQGWL